MKEEKNTQKYNLVVSGGTFDAFHIGHKAFLNYQLKISKKILLGLTSDNYLTNFPKIHEVEPFLVRKKIIENFLKEQNAFDRVEIVPLDSRTPRDLENYSADAIVVTPETLKGAKDINEVRRKKGLKSLRVLVFNMITSFDNIPISSTRIRSGEINSSGEINIDKNWLSMNLYITKPLRKALKEPFGTLIKNNNFDFRKVDPHKIITVGDVASKTFIDLKITQKIAIVDLVVEREKKYKSIEELGFKDDINLIKVKNQAGSITPGLWEAISTALKYLDSSVIQIEGEEDLTVLPAIVLSPIGWSIFYGQPKKGLVHLKVTKSTKNTALLLLKKFSAKL